jgi:hypothetical protein
MDIDTQHQGLQLIIHRFLGDLKYHGSNAGLKTPPDYSITTGGGKNDLKDESSSATISGGREDRQGGRGGLHGSNDRGDAWIVDVQEQTLLRQLFESSPVRLCTIHMCIPSDRSYSEGPEVSGANDTYKNELFEMVTMSTMEIFGPQDRGRTRIHEGTEPWTPRRPFHDESLSENVIPYHIFSSPIHISLCNSRLTMVYLYKNFIRDKSYHTFDTNTNQSSNTLATGTITGCHEALVSYGIPIQWIPMTSTGRLKMKEHEQWIAMQSMREKVELDEELLGRSIGRFPPGMIGSKTGTAFQQSSQSFVGGVTTSTTSIPSSSSLSHSRFLSIFDDQFIECPRTSDILMSKSRRVWNHPGNILLRSVLESRYEERSTAHAVDKIIVTQQVATDLQENYHCRFLIKNQQDLWVEAERHVVIEKLGNSFRFVPRLKYQRHPETQNRRHNSTQDKDNQETLTQLRKQEGGEILQEVDHKIQTKKPPPGNK